MGDGQDERTFLCGYQRTRGYGSLSNPQGFSKAYHTVIRHQVRPSDTLQGLVLRYNTSMSEIKRLNRLWSNESLYMKHYIDVPIYTDVEVRSASNPSLNAAQTDDHLGAGQDSSSESVQDIFKRIDMNIRKTSNDVNKLVKNSPQHLEVSKTESPKKAVGRRSLSHNYSGHKSESYQG